jgi:hypothetical protein
VGSSKNSNAKAKKGKTPNQFIVAGLGSAGERDVSADKIVLTDKRKKPNQLGHGL